MNASAATLSTKSVYGGHLGCTQNATAGEEHRRGWHPERFSPSTVADRDVLIVGAGPAGLECAIVLAKRGHRRIHLVDANPELGGRLRWLTRLPGLGEWSRIVNWRAIQLHKLRRQVQHIPSTTLTAEAIREYGAEIVVLATGSRWQADLAGVEGALTPEDLIDAGARPPGDRCVIVDRDGYHVAAALAWQLADEGRQVELVTSHPHVAQLAEQTLEGWRLRRTLHDAGVTMRVDTTIDGARDGALVGATDLGEPVELTADGVVLVTERRSDDALYLELAAEAGPPGGRPPHR